MQFGILCALQRTAKISGDNFTVYLENGNKLVKTYWRMGFGEEIEYKLNTLKIIILYNDNQIYNKRESGHLHRKI